MPAAPDVLDLLLTLGDVDPSVWRLVRVSSGATLARAQRVFCTCFGWSWGRPYAFEALHLRYPGRGREVEEEANAVRLRQLLPDVGSAIEFAYGGARGWDVRVLVVRRFPASAGLVTPRCLEAEGIAPPLDAGGAIAWNERLQEAIEDPSYDFATRMADSGRATRPGAPLAAINAELAVLR
ncbi:MAG: hypothetical protein MNPFHGCM_02656 [Gemmatimonadaceae bacterium]|nr:hypothetical protein [Gemmatimonadaceae bacterium]